MTELSENTPQITRRDFLTPWKRFIPSKNPIPQGQDTPKIPTSTTEFEFSTRPSLTRRQFLKFIIATGTSLVAQHYLNTNPAQAKEANHQLLEKNDSITKKMSISRQDTETSREQTSPDKKTGLVDTIVESSLLNIAEIISMPILTSLRIPIGNAGFDQETVKKMLNMPSDQSLFNAGILGPLIEEVIFRALPNSYIQNQSRNSVWHIGIPVSVIFALSHNVVKDDKTDKHIFTTDKIPLYQFISGLFFWKMMRERGLSHAVMAHATINSTALTMAKILYKAFPSKSYAEDFLGGINK